jgi:arylsulfatase A-like enzyme
MKPLPLVLALLGCSLATDVHGADAKPARKPNVLVFLTDDMGYGDHACLGNPVLKTPNWDRLHAGSVRLTDFHVAPMCTPTRGQLLTGVDACRSGATSVCAGRSFVRRGIPLLPEAFAANGYRTAMYGKWHLGDSYPNLPHQRGFHDAVYHLGWGITSMADRWQNDLFDGWFAHNGTLKQYKGYCTDIFFDLGITWMKDCQKRGEPFFLYLPTNSAHGPHWVPAKYLTPYQGKGPAAFLGMVANLDENLGRLETFLRESGLRDDTIVVYLNDNGGTAGVPVYNAGMRGRKTTYYEGGHRAACFVRWPNGGLRKAGDVDELTQVQDLMPTLLELCGVPAPKAAKFDGSSLAGLLRGTQEQLPDRTLVVQYGQRPTKGDAAVLWGKWRLVSGKELYDLKNDPGQKTDVAEKHPDVVKQMRSHYEKWWASVEPTLDDFSPISIGSEKENPVTLTAADWANVYCDNMQNLRQGVNRNGPWHLLVEKDGTYEVELRRWPKEADAAMAAGVPEFKATQGGLPAGQALPVAKARLKVGDLDETKPVGAKDRGVTFSVKLKAGLKLAMQSWLYDADGKELAGAYFAYVRRN